MAAATGYSVFLVPPQESLLYTELRTCINEIAEAKGTPSFIPHTTLIGGMVGDEKGAIERTKLLSKSLRQFDIRLGDLGSNGIYFQMLFSKVDPTESVMHSNQRAQEIFGMNSGKYFPHLSLAYGDFQPQEVQEIQTNILNRKRMLIGGRYTVQEIELWNTDGEVPAWRKIATFPITGN